MNEYERTKADESNKGRCPGNCQPDEDEVAGGGGGGEVEVRRIAPSDEIYVAGFYAVHVSDGLSACVAPFCAYDGSMVRLGTAQGIQRACARMAAGTRMIVRRW